MAFVITGCGRSGTMGTAVLLDSLGVRTSFEEFFSANTALEDVQARFDRWLSATGTVGEVSGLAAPYLSQLPGTIILHQVRNPVAVLASLMGEWSMTEDRMRWMPNIKFNRRCLPELSIDDEPLVFYMKYWLLWNEMIESFAVLRYKVEDLGFPSPILDAILQHIGQTAKAEAVYNPVYNHGHRDPRVTWRAIPSSQLKERIYQKALVYGYTEADLDTYCASPETCNHCHRAFANLQDAMIVQYPGRVHYRDRR